MIYKLIVTVLLLVILRKKITICLFIHGLLLESVIIIIPWVQKLWISDTWETKGSFQALQEYPTPWDLSSSGMLRDADR